ncbi:MAG: 5-oxoprolinase subunit PxpA [Microbacterium sp.]
MRTIDLNADLGETVGGVPTADDEAMFAVVSSASVACGGHAGDAASMRDAVARGIRHGVAIGAHPSYPDRARFGRAVLTIAPAELRSSVAAQLDALAAAGADVRYVKPHGALYHAAGSGAVVADAVVAAVADLAARIGRPLPLLGLGGALAVSAARAGLPFVREAFLDRGYLDDGSLVPRGSAGDLLHDPREAADRALRLVGHGEIVAVDGAVVSTDAASLCLHGDTAESVAMARAVRAALDGAGIAVRAPW